MRERVPSGAMPSTGTEDGEDATGRALSRWCGTAVRELPRHTPVDGLCSQCGARWPSATCALAELALGALS